MPTIPNWIRSLGLRGAIVAATAVLGKRVDRQLVAEQARDDFRMNLRVSELRGFIFVSPVSEEKGKGGVFFAY
jgi:hypothetical protein